MSEAANLHGLDWVTKNPPLVVKERVESSEFSNEISSLFKDTISAEGRHLKTE